jgi:acetylornithine deacetylase/succinyl-diaminopimelate desuccinylase-like protein
LRGTLVVAATVAEETGGSPGVRTLVGETLRDLELKPTHAVLCDPTDLGLYYGHDGWIEMDVRVQGSNPFHVRDAAQAILGGLEDGRRSLGAGETAEFQSLLPPASEELAGASSTMIRIVRRLLPTESENDVLSETRRSVGVLARSAGSVAVQVAVRTENQRLYTGQMTAVRHVTHAWATDPFHPLMERSRQALAAAGCAVRPGKWVLGRLGMGTAGGVLLDEFSIPTIGYGPGVETKCHAPNETVSEARIIAAVYGTAAIAHALVGVPVCGWTSEEI